MARTTHSERISALETTVRGLAEGQNRIIALLEAQAPAKVTRPKAATPKKAVTRKARKAQPKAATKGSRMAGHGSGMTKQDWNRTLSAKARFAGGDTYRRVMADWAEVQTLRVSGATPDEVLGLFA